MSRWPTLTGRSWYPVIGIYFLWAVQAGAFGRRVFLWFQLKIGVKNNNKNQ
jgi:hypothetical protein